MLSSPLVPGARPPHTGSALTLHTGGGASLCHPPGDHVPMTYPVVHPWDLIRGDSAQLRVVYTSSAEPATTVDGWQVAMQVRRDTDAEVWLEKTPDQGLVLEVEDGKLVVSISIDPSDTRDWGRARWNGMWDLQITHPSGKVRTPIGGPFRVHGDVTVVAA